MPDAPQHADLAVLGVGPEYVLSEDDLNLDEDDEAESGDLDGSASGDAPARESGSSSEAGYGFNTGLSLGSQTEEQGFDGPADLLADTEPDGAASAAPQPFDTTTLLSGGDLDGVQVSSTAGLILDGTAGDDVLTGGAGDDTISGFGGDDTLSGGAGNDTLNGALGVDTLNGDDGNDTLNGGGDDDALNGGTGDDTLDGGSNDDTLTGGAGNDTFIMKPGMNEDVITDFAAGGAADKIDVSALGVPDFASLSIADNAFGEAVIDFGGGAEVTLVGVSTISLGAGDFIF